MGYGMLVFAVGVQLFCLCAGGFVALQGESNVAFVLFGMATLVGLHASRSN